MVVMVTETHITKDIEDSETTIPGYNSYTSFSDSRHTGGVTIYVKNFLKCEVIEAYQVPKEYWCILIKAQYLHEKVVFGGFYRSPHGKILDFLNFFDSIFETEFISQHKGVLAGDFNINLMENSTYSKRCSDIASAAGFRQIIKLPTRCTKDSQTLVDHIYTNIAHMEEVERKFPILTDHEIIGTSLSTNMANENCEFMRNLSKNKIEEINLELLGQQWESSSTDVNVLYSNFITNISGTVEKISPLQKRPGNSRILWIDNEVIQSQKERDRLYKIFKYTKQEKDFENFKQQRNKVVALLRKKERSFYEQKINENRSDSKKMWQVLKTLINKGKKNVNFSTLDICQNTTEIEDTINDYFVKSIQDIVETIPEPEREFEEIQFKIKDSIKEFRSISLNKLERTITQLKNKSSGDDILSVKLLKNIFHTVGFPLLNLINTSIKKGMLPAELKISTVVPIPKVNFPKKGEELRPINLLPVVEKVIERVVHEQINEYLEKKAIFYEGQSGFRNKHSCESACQLVLSKWKKEIDNGNIIVSVFVDLKRAFETIDRQKLLKTCEVYGIEGTVLKWLQHYLTDRHQRTKIGVKSSQKSCIKYGVPQGSVLGPLLFILYINDVKRYLTKSDVNLYADDTVISVSGPNFKEVVDIINKELNIFKNWLYVKKLKLNSTKTKCMVFGTRNKCKLAMNEKLHIKIDSVIIEQVTEVQYLGIKLDQYLTLNKHVDFICKKLGKKIGYFNRISNKLSERTRGLVYNTIIYPQFTYCISLLIYCRKEDISRIQILQNRVMRILLGCNKQTRIKDMLKQLNFLNIEQMIEEANLILIYKIINGLTPRYLQQFLTKRNNMTDYNLRFEEGYFVERFNTSILEKSLFVAGLRSYNNLPRIVKISSNIRTFKTRLRKIYYKI